MLASQGPVLRVLRRQAMRVVAAWVARLEAPDRPQVRSLALLIISAWSGRAGQGLRARCHTQSRQEHTGWRGAAGQGKGAHARRSFPADDPLGQRGATRQGPGELTQSLRAWLWHAVRAVRPQVYSALLACMAEPDACTQLTAVTSLHALVDDWNFSEGAFEPFVATAMQLLLNVLGTCSDLGSQGLVRTRGGGQEVSAGGARGWRDASTAFGRVV